MSDFGMAVLIYIAQSLRADVIDRQTAAELSSSVLEGGYSAYINAQRELDRRWYDAMSV